MRFFGHGRSTIPFFLMLGGASLLLALAACSGNSTSGESAAPEATPNPTTVTVPTYTIGGTVAGLSGTAVLQNNGADDLALTEDGPFTFSAGLEEGASYEVSVFTQPAEQTCAIVNGKGLVEAEAITDMEVVCSAETYSVGGTVSGLAGALVLQNNDADDLTLTANGAFTFETRLPDGISYTVTVLTQPTDQTCSLGNATGQIAGADVTNVSIACVAGTGVATIAGLNVFETREQVELDWTNPSEDYAGVRVLRREDGTFPAAYDDTGAASVFEGDTDSLVDSGLTNGTTYYYAIFTFNAESQYAFGAATTATPDLSKWGSAIFGRSLW